MIKLLAFICRQCWYGRNEKWNFSSARVLSIRNNMEFLIWWPFLLKAGNIRGKCSSDVH